MTSQQQLRNPQPATRNSQPVPIAIYGAGGLGREVKTIIDAINLHKQVYNFIGFFDDGKKGKDIIGSLNDLNQWKDEIYLVVGIGAPLVKHDVVSSITNDKVKFEKLIHPSAIIGDNNMVAIGPGSIVTAGSILTTDIKIGSHVLINLNATIGHDAVLGDCCSIMPGVNIAGAVKIEPCVLVGSGANIINAVNIGRAATIGSGAVVTKDVQASTTVIGIPARPLTKSV